MARVTIRIPDWKERELAPGTFAVPARNAEARIQLARPWKEKP